MGPYSKLYKMYVMKKIAAEQYWKHIQGKCLLKMVTLSWLAYIFLGKIIS